MEEGPGVLPDRRLFLRVQVKCRVRRLAGSSDLPLCREVASGFVAQMMCESEWGESAGSRQGAADGPPHHHLWPPETR